MRQTNIFYSGVDHLFPKKEPLLFCFHPHERVGFVERTVIDYFFMKQRIICQSSNSIV
jgi:hypothetical protein